MRRIIAPLVVGLGVATIAWFVGRQLAHTSWNPVITEPTALVREAAQPLASTVGEASEPAFVENAWRKNVAEWRKERSLARRAHRLFEMTRDFALADFALALQALSATPEGIWEERGPLVELWAERDLQGARAWIEAQPPKERNLLRYHCATVWARLDAAGFRRWLSESEEHRKEWINAALNGPALRKLAESDPRAMLALLPAGFTRRFSNCVFDVWATRDPTAAAAEALAMPTPESRRMAIGSVAIGWTTRDPAEAAAWIEQLGDASLVDAGWRAFFSEEFVQRNPRTALQTILEKAPPALRNEYLPWIAGMRARENPEVVLALAEHEPEDVRRILLDQAIEAVSLDDPQRAAELCMKENAASGRVLGSMEKVAQELSRKGGVAEALRFLDRIQVDAEEAAKKIAAGVASSRGWPAVAEAALQMPPGTRRESWFSQALQSLVESGEIPAAQRLLARLPAGTEKEALAALLVPATAP